MPFGVTVIIMVPVPLCLSYLWHRASLATASQLSPTLWVWMLVPVRRWSHLLPHYSLLRGHHTSRGRQCESSARRPSKSSLMLQLQRNCVLVSGVGVWVVQCERAIIPWSAVQGRCVSRPFASRQNVKPHAKDHHPSRVDTLL